MPLKIRDIGSWDISSKMKKMNETFNERYIGVGVSVGVGQCEHPISSRHFSQKQNGSSVTAPSGWLHQHYWKVQVWSVSSKTHLIFKTLRYSPLLVSLFLKVKVWCESLLFLFLLNRVLFSFIPIGKKNNYAYYFYTFEHFGTNWK